ncbi:hypothetical protein DKG34_23340 [Streptomyces sp. NWU49]|nr:hypothetical protein DKG34_23340 [Streptomyces sp. NWU49]
MCAAVCEGLEVGGATLSLLTDIPSRQLLAASNDAALLLEEIQFTVLEGPASVPRKPASLWLWPICGTN